MTESSQYEQKTLSSKVEPENKTKQSLEDCNEACCQTIVNYGYISESAMFMTASIFELSDVAVSALVDISRTHIDCHYFSDSWSFPRSHIALSYDVVCACWKSCHWRCNWWKVWVQADWLEQILLDSHYSQIWQQESVWEWRRNKFHS